MLLVQNIYKVPLRHISASVAMGTPAAAAAAHTDAANAFVLCACVITSKDFVCWAFFSSSTSPSLLLLLSFILVIHSIKYTFNTGPPGNVVEHGLWCIVEEKRSKMNE